MPRAKIWGFLATFLSVFLLAFVIYAIFIGKNDHVIPVDLNTIGDMTYYTMAVPLLLVSLFIFGTGFWIGWTIITIKVVPPMPEIVDKNDYSKIKAAVLCAVTLALALMLVYGFYLRVYWALAIPAAVISLVILGAVFWVGMAIITTRNTLPKGKEEP